jgi:hypothetical protein
MAASYPSAVKSFTTKTDGPGQTVFAAHVNDIQDEVVAIESALVNGPIKPAIGSAGAPPYSFAGNATTGLYSSGTNALELATNGVKALGIDATQFIDSPTQPRCIAYHNTTQSVPDATETVLLLNSEDVDVATMHDTVTNNSRITIPTGGDGFYHVIGYTTVQFNITGYRRLSISKNGTPFRTVQFPAGPNNSADEGILIDRYLQLAAGDYLELSLKHTGGSALNAGSATRADSTELCAVKKW